MQTADVATIAGRLFAASLCGTLLACADARPPDSSSSSPSDSAAAANPRPEFPGCDSSHRERMLDSRAAFIARYPVTADSTTRPDTVLVGPATRLCSPSAIALAPTGELYVLNAVHSNALDAAGQPVGWRYWVMVYGPGALLDVPPTRSFSVAASNGIAVDSKGNAWLSGSGPGPLDPGSVSVYAPDADGNVEPVRPHAFDGRGRLQAINQQKNVMETDETIRISAAGAVAPDRVIAGPQTRLFAPRALSFDGRGRLYVSNMVHPQLAPPHIVYPADAAGDVAPLRTVRPEQFYPDWPDPPRRLAADRRGYLHVANGPRPGGDGIVRVYGPLARGAPDPVRVIAGPETAMSRTFGIGRDSRGNIYVTSGSQTGGKVLVYRPDAYGNEPPIRTIDGPETLLREPRQLAIGPGDSLYVLNVFGFWRCASSAPREVTVTVYPPGASGSVEPAHEIVVTREGRTAGQKLGLTRPRGLAVDGTGAVYVSFDRPDRVAVFPPGADGAVAPVRTLRMHGTYNEPSALAIAPDGSLYVVAFLSPTMCL